MISFLIFYYEKVILGENVIGYMAIELKNCRLI